MANILWIQDLDPFQTTGGAQITDAYKIRALEKVGHEVFWRENPIPLLEKHDIDFAVISNAKWVKNNYSQELKKLLQEKEVPWIKFEHDHSCNWRANFPMIDRCQREDCPAKETYGWHYREAKGIVYLSPWHKEGHDYWDGFNLNRIPSLVTPPYIPYQEIIDAQDRTIREKNTVMLLAGMYKFKGFYSNMNYAMDNPQLTYRNYTHPESFTQDEIATLEKVGLGPMGTLSHNMVYSKMAEHEYFLHKSDHFLPFERVTLEAFFAGCKVISNRNVGSTSYSWWGNYDNTIRAMNRTRDDFVDFVEVFL